MIEYPPLVEATDIARASNGRVREDDPRVSTLVAGATAGIRRYCGWHVAPEVTEELKPRTVRGNFVQLPTLRLVEVLGMTSRYHDRDGVTHEKAADLWALDWSPDGSIRWLWNSFPDRYQGTTFHVRHGFGDDAKAALGAVVSQVVLNALASPMGATREQTGQVSVSWALTAPGVSGGLTLLERDYDILNLYRLEP